MRLEFRRRAKTKPLAAKESSTPQPPASKRAKLSNSLIPTDTPALVVIDVPLKLSSIGPLPVGPTADKLPQRTSQTIDIISLQHVPPQQPEQCRTKRSRKEEEDEKQEKEEKQGTSSRKIISSKQGSVPAESTLATLSTNPPPPTTATVIKSLLKSEPAHVRYKSLISAPIQLPSSSASLSLQSTTSSQTQHLKLPAKYEVLLQMFFALETSVLFMKSRGQACIYHKIKRSVENICNRNFELLHLGQILTVLPAAYKTSLISVVHIGSRVKSVLIEMETSFEGQDNFHTQAINVSRQHAQRKIRFRANLLDIAQKTHLEFLLSKNIEKHAGDWHPDFDLESVEDITPAALPTDDNAKILDTASSKSIATSSSSPSVSSSSPIVHTVPLRNDEKDSAAGPTEADIETQKTNEIGNASKMSGLLARIRAKEQRKLQENPNRFNVTPQDVQMATLFSRLSEMATCMHFFYNSCKKTGMLMTDLLAHLVNSHKTPITTANAQICLRKINEVCPDWCSIVKLSDGKEVVKVNPQINICEVMLKLRKIHS